jgi:hypothetical protein
MLKHRRLLRRVLGLFRVSQLSLQRYSGECRKAKLNLHNPEKFRMPDQSLPRTRSGVRHDSTILRLFICMLCILLCAGCGKKGDPIPPKMTLPPAVSDLGAVSASEGVVLNWSISGTTERIDHFRIIRSEAAADQACPGCPQDYKPFVTLKVADQNLRREGENGFRYVDAAVETGRFYSYRVAACDSRGNCSESSASAGCLWGMR